MSDVKIENVRIAKVLPKGQVTIPKDVRDSLGAREGDVIVFAKIDGVWTIDRQPADLVEFMRQIGEKLRPMTQEELDEIDASGRESEERWERRYGI
jgi:AbrB family looped-hinge helix DNA binding protein